MRESVLKSKRVRGGREKEKKKFSHLSLFLALLFFFFNDDRLVLSFGRYIIQLKSV